MIVHTKHSKESTTPKLLKLKSEFSKVTGIKINIQNLIIFQYFISELLENETKKQFIYNCRKNIKYPKMNLR